MFVCLLFLADCITVALMLQCCIHRRSSNIYIVAKWCILPKTVWQNKQKWPLGNWVVTWPMTSCDLGQGRGSNTFKAQYYILKTADELLASLAAHVLFTTCTLVSWDIYMREMWQVHWVHWV